MRKLLSNTATTPSSPGAGDLILPLLRNFPPGWLPCVISTHADPLTSSGTKARRGTRARRIPRARIRKVNSAHGRERRGAGVARALRTVAEAALQASKEYQGALSGDSECWGVGSSVHQMSSGGAKECGGPLPAFQAWGPLGVLNISVASSQVDWACGGRDAGRRLLSREAWSWLENFFRTANVCRQVGSCRARIENLANPYPTHGYFHVLEAVAVVIRANYATTMVYSCPDFPDALSSST